MQFDYALIEICWPDGESIRLIRNWGWFETADKARQAQPKNYQLPENGWRFAVISRSAYTKHRASGVIIDEPFRFRKQEEND